MVDVDTCAVTASITELNAELVIAVLVDVNILLSFRNGLYGMGAGTGVEPVVQQDESCVLPLHYPAI